MQTNHFINTLKHNRRIPIAVMAITIFIFLINTVSIFNDFRTHQIRQEKIEANTPIPIAPKIASSHLFGAFDSARENFPETQLELTLEGIMLAPKNPNQSYAIISSPSKPAQAYRVGSLIIGNTILKKILSDRIILDDNGAKQYLKLPTEKISPQD